MNTVEEYLACRERDFKYYMNSLKSGFVYNWLAQKLITKTGLYSFMKEDKVRKLNGGFDF